LLLLLVAGLLAGCGGGDDDGDGDGGTSAGATVFSENCGSCHTFAPAGTSGTIGPNLDETEVTFEQAVEQVRNGGGGMPAFEDQLSEEEIEAVARYITEEGSATGEGGGSVVGPFDLTARG
jgi:mono/diheme cytochrome c family protein